MIELRKSGRHSMLRNNLADLNASIAYIPRVVRETMLPFRLLPAQNLDITKPQLGKPAIRPTAALASSHSEIGALFRANPGLDYQVMRYEHPIVGSNHVLQMLQDLLRSRQFARVA